MCAESDRSGFKSVAPRDSFRRESAESHDSDLSLPVPANQTEIGRQIVWTANGFVTLANV